MDSVYSALLKEMVKKHKEKAKSLFPELIKKLILSSTPSVQNIRLPGKDDVWAPGFDGVVENEKASRYVCEGVSVWEIGTNDDPLKKINEDYDKRTANPLGIDKENAEFYLVIPYIWAFNNQGYSLTDWESQHTDWKKTHVYDASVLEEWIKTSPSVCAWFLEELNEIHGIDFDSVPCAWKRFSDKTTPPLPNSLFLIGREEKTQVLLERKKNAITRIKADTSTDALGFCLSSLLTDLEASNLVTVVKNQNTYRELSRFCSGQTFLLTFLPDCDILEGNSVILCYGREDRTVQPDILLPPLTKKQFEKAISEMDLPDRIANYLYENTHGSILSLMRRLPGLSPEGRPGWADLPNISKLSALMLLKAFDIQNPSDQNIVAFLSNEKWEDIQEQYVKWSRLEDAPVRQIENHIQLMSFDDAWQVLQFDATMPVFERMVHLIKAIASQKTDEEVPDGIVVDYYSKKHLPDLFLDLIYFSNETNGRSVLEKAIKDLLNEQPVSIFILEYLYLLAEAAPETVMDYLEGDYTKEKGQIKTAFSKESYPAIDHYILFALDELVRHNTTKIRACNMLFNLCVFSQKREFKTANTPEDSLLNALWLYGTHTALSLKDKEKLIFKYLEKDSVYATAFCVELLTKKSIFVSYRNGSSRKLQEEPDVFELTATINSIGQKAFSNSISNHDTKSIKALLNHFSMFSPNLLTDAASSFDSAQFSIENLTELNYLLRQLEASVSKDPNETTCLPALKMWVECTTSKDEVVKNGWMFYDYWFLPNDLFENEEKWEEKEKKKEKTRADTMNVLISKRSIESLLQLVQCSKDEYNWGLFYTSFFSGNSFMLFVEETKKHKKDSIRLGLLDGASKEDCVRYIDSLDPQEQYDVLSRLSRLDLADFINTPEKERAYWKWKQMKTYDDKVFEKLLKYNPCGLLQFFAFWSKMLFSRDIDKIMKVLESIICIMENGKQDFDLTRIQYVIDRAEREGYYSDEWADLCAKLYEKKLLLKCPEILKKFYFCNPERFCKMIELREESVLPSLSVNYELPDIAYCDLPAFDSFVSTIMNKQKEYNYLVAVLGSVLGKSKVGTDGIFPHEYVRMALERYVDEKLTLETLIGKENTDGVRTIEDGTREQALARKCYKHSEELAIEYPETAKLLRKLGDHYKSEGKSDRIYSEIGPKAF